MAKKVKKSPTRLSGDVMYHYLQKELRLRDVWMFQSLTARLIADLGIWFHPTVYEQLPILLPHVVRDAEARGRRGGVDQWGAPDKNGYVRDDNSLIKLIPKSLMISAPNHAHYDGKRLGNGWVASHVWRLCADGSSAAKNALTNSFVPNLVWLPDAVSKLTDREGAFVQRYTQALAYKIYGHREVHSGLKVFTDEAWKNLELPVDIPEEGLPDIDSLNYFVPDDEWFRRRIGFLRKATGALGMCAGGEASSGKVSPGRWVPGLRKLSSRSTSRLRRSMQKYMDAVLAASP